MATGFKLGERIQIRRNHYTVVGLTRRMVSSGGDPMVFIPLKDAQEAQFLKDNDAIAQQRRRTAANPAFNRPGVPGLLDAVIASQSVNPYVNAVLVQIKPGFIPEEVAEPIRRWKRLQVYTRAQMEEILIGKLIATSARQIGMFLVILAIVSAAIVAFIIYTLTLGKIREIAVLKLIGTKNRTIAGMILQQALGPGPDRLRGGQDRRHLLGADLSQICPARTGRCGARLRRGDGDLRAGERAGHPRRTQGGPGGGDRWLT